MSEGNIKYQLYRLFWGMIDLIYPPVCGGCGKNGPRWCEDCQKSLKLLVGPVCDICGLPQERSGVCYTCLAERPHFHALRAWTVFDNPIRSALHKLKYRHDISLGEALARQMVPFIRSLDWPIDIIVPIPLGQKRYKERGYNQVGMVALPVSLALKLEYLPKGLARQKETRTQVGLTRNERRENVFDAFVANSSVRGKTVLVMDDVSTTGSTLSSSAHALIISGAKEVYALAISRALPHHGLKHV